MPIKRRKRKLRIARITADLLPVVERLLELQGQHLAAIRGDDRTFYSDGRHEELIAHTVDVYSALSIKPWQDASDIIAEALAAVE